MKRTDFLQLLKENNQAAIEQAINAALQGNDNLNEYEDVTEFTQTPLLDAVNKGNQIAVNSLLASKNVLVDGNGWGYSPLMIASAKGYTDIVKQLLAKEANSEYEVEWSQTGRTCIEIIRTNDTKTKRFEYFKHKKYCAIDTAETLAISHGHDDLFKLLLSSRKKPLNFDDNRLLCNAAQNNQWVIAKYLVELGFSPKKPNHKQETPLVLAARYSSFQVVQYLLTLDMDQEDIHVALKEVIDQQDITDAVEIIEMLMNADKNLQKPIQEESGSETLMDYAARRFEIPVPIVGGFSDFGASVSDDLYMKKMTVVNMLLEAEVPRTQPTAELFSDGKAFAAMKQTHDALLAKGLHAKVIAKSISDQMDQEGLTEVPSDSPTTLSDEVRAEKASQRFDALLTKAKPDDIDNEPFTRLVFPFYSFFQDKKDNTVRRQHALPPKNPDSIFLRTLRVPGLLYSEVDKDLVVNKQIEPAVTSNSISPTNQ